MSGEVIEIEYQLTVDDYAKFSADTAMRHFGRPKFSQSFIKTCLAFFILLSCLFFTTLTLTFLFSNYFFFKEWLSSLLELYSNYFFIMVIPLTFAFVVLISMFPDQKSRHRCLYNNAKYQINLGKKRMTFAPRKVELSSKCIAETSEFYEVCYKWAGMDSVSLQAGDLCFFTSSMSALIIPSRFFKSEEEKQRVYEQCLTWWQAAQEKPAESEAA